MYDYELFYDYKYEEFRSSTGHITDFDTEQYHLYHKAIQEYSNIDPEKAKTLSVNTGYHSHQGGLYFYGDGDLGPFWRVFDKLNGK